MICNFIILSSGFTDRTRGGNLLPSHDSIRFRFLRPRFDSKSIFDSKRFSIQNNSILFIMISNQVSDHDLLSSALQYRMTNGDIKVSFSHLLSSILREVPFIKNIEKIFLLGTFKAKYL